ncbi:PAS domain-containing sensor histidine kinase [Polyangium aurulentum]|uniref:PAS domain-containing sensor histidine kinase n=1 Tax=Polyangium aurulentum TaxID=2567896 RepID=UPI0010ADE604|nr:PAS domain-containing sensor histidine kinase [Polyangium aurulentum]UQA60960.1 PAS domain-containing sensor histidine kinase [Polyangium aurulentum]
MSSPEGTRPDVWDEVAEIATRLEANPDPKDVRRAAAALKEAIAEARRAEATLRQKEEREREELVAAFVAERRWLRAVIERSPVGIVLCQIEGGFRIETNPRAEELLGTPLRTTDDINVLLERMRMPDGGPIPLEELSMSQALKGATVTGRELLIQREDGRRIPVLVSASPIRDERGQILGAVATYEDITELRQLERLREEWTSVVAHDLRHPLTTIMTVAGMLSRKLDEPARSKLQRIVTSSTRLARMIDDLLDISRLEARRLEIVCAPTDLRALLDGAVEHVVEEGRQISVEVRGEIPPLFIDPQRIEQVVENLLSNALKYGAPGTPIDIAAERRGDEVVVAVQNEGPGIPPEDVPGLFARFQRGKTGSTSIKGLGLGLYVSKGLIEAHGGRIWVESEPCKTTTFFFSLPLARDQREA